MSQSAVPTPVDPEFERRVEAEAAKLSKVEPIATILTRLSGILPDDLHYHSVSHTHNVLSESIRFGLFDKLSDRAILLLAVAASYHDAGYVFRRVNNEELGALLSDDAMRDTNNFSEDEVALVHQMILDTQLVETPDGPKQVAHTELSKYLLDADLGNFGRDDFFDRLDAYLLESKAERLPLLKRTLALLQSHSWYTNAARVLRQAKKEENISKLLELIDAISE